MIGPDPIAAAAIAFGLTFALSPVFRRLARPFGHLDVPNERSSHRAPTPRSGGLAIVIGTAGAAVAAAITNDRAVSAVLVGTALLGTMALIDERRPLPRRGRLLVQIGVAALVVALGDLAITAVALPGASAELGPLAPLFTVIWIVGVVNVYNFMDGANGLAASQAIVAGAALALMLGPADPVASTLALAVVGAAAGFLPWNFPRASMFMGDTGSNALGLALAALTARAVGAGIPLPAAALPLAPFLLDASVTVLVRIARGEAFFSTSHRLHFYQRLLDRGWSHAQVTAAWSALAVVSAVAALAYLGAGPPAAWALIGAIVAIHAAVGGAILLGRHRPMIGAS